MGRSKASTCLMISLLRLKLAAAGRAGDALVPLSPGTATSRYMQKEDLPRGPTRKLLTTNMWGTDFETPYQ